MQRKHAYNYIPSIWPDGLTNGRVDHWYSDCSFQWIISNSQLCKTQHRICLLSSLFQSSVKTCIPEKVENLKLRIEATSGWKSLLSLHMIHFYWPGKIEFPDLVFCRYHALPQAVGRAMFEFLQAR
eukprot:gnl/MRDRNA2_/MRDRNA2_139646_c0_seq1.p1 gnl/MRDRNA2_/MRDRNA2_139646_c0~~gnl/MRDRNA2_/MRDRNA2_139646_c0_seq1.p1  ORF type:complete len:126 (+),score=4.94 gnl/MRDRNA2_/MRDRNA2_139646_c0_seq1:349-726(+)